MGMSAEGELFYGFPWREFEGEDSEAWEAVREFMDENWSIYNQMTELHGVEVYLFGHCDYGYPAFVVSKSQRSAGYGKFVALTPESFEVPRNWKGNLETFLVELEAELGVIIPREEPQWFMACSYG